MPGPTSHSYFSQRLRLHYVDWGNPDKPPLLMVHGGRDHCRNWDWVAQALRDDYHIIAPDLRGHGDSQWVIGGGYAMADYVYDIAQLVHQRKMAPLKIMAHSLGGMISLRYTGLFPETVSKIIAIEGLGASPKLMKERTATPHYERLRNWVGELRKTAGRQPRRYASLEDAYARMQSENPHLTPAQARHLTIHGISQNEDGTFSWKFDNYVRIWPPVEEPAEILHDLWSRIECPTLLVRGLESWASDPVKDGRIEHFKHAEVANFEKAGHWVHHDKLDDFVALARDFLADD